jgi:hypothetical protein
MGAQLRVGEIPQASAEVVLLSSSRLTCPRKLPFHQQPNQCLNHLGFEVRQATQHKYNLPLSALVDSC